MLFKTLSGAYSGLWLPKKAFFGVFWFVTVGLTSIDGACGLIPSSLALICFFLSFFSSLLLDFYAWLSKHFNTTLQFIHSLDLIHVLSINILLFEFYKSKFYFQFHPPLIFKFVKFFLYFLISIIIYSFFFIFSFSLSFIVFFYFGCFFRLIFFYFIL